MTPSTLAQDYAAAHAEANEPDPETVARLAGEERAVETTRPNESSEEL